MNILPQKYSQFRDKGYWNHFFSSLKNTKDEFFQWYGDYRDYRHLLNEAISNQSRIFHVGCGKSIFAQDLHADFGSACIMNCDYSEQIIAQMQERTKKMGLKNVQYEVVDLLQPLQQKYEDVFDVVLDKGTLDALLPEDDPVNIQTVKNKYFANIQKSLKKEQNKSIIIISLLQPFVLRTLLQHFQKSNFHISIHQCLLKDSKLQPFYVRLVQGKEKKSLISLHLLEKKEVIQINQIKQAMERVRKIQQNIEHSGNIKRLIGGQRTKYNIYNSDGIKSLRYVIEIIDSQDKEMRNLNNCSVFVVPQGKQNSYLFNTDEGVKDLSAQIKCSRLILAKLVTGNNFKNLQQVKKQLNSVLPDLIQQGCNPKNVPYLTDGDSLGKRQYVFENEEFIIDQVLVDNEPYRRLYAKSNLKTPQCQVKLAYAGVNSPGFALSKGIDSKILPKKKGMYTGVDKKCICDDNGQAIYAGISCFLGQPRLIKGSKILIFGLQIALAKYITENFQNIQVTVVSTKKSLAKVASQCFQMPDTVSLQIINTNSLLQFFKLRPEQVYDAIVVADNILEKGCNPDPSLFQKQFLSLICDRICDNGILIVQIWEYQWTPNLLDVFFPIYASNAHAKDDNILFALKYHKQYMEKDGQNVLIVPEQLINPQPKCSKIQAEWQIDYFKDFLMIQPNILEKQSQNLIVSKQKIKEDPYSTGMVDKKGKNKKKKKK